MLVEAIFDQVAEREADDGPRVFGLGRPPKAPGAEFDGPEERGGEDGGDAVDGDLADLLRMAVVAVEKIQYLSRTYFTTNPTAVPTRTDASTGSAGAERTVSSWAARLAAPETTAKAT